MFPVLINNEGINILVSHTTNDRIEKMHKAGCYFSAIVKSIDGKPHIVIIKEQLKFKQQKLTLL